MLRDQKVVHYSVRKTLQCYPTLNHFYRVHIPRTCSSKIQFNIVFPSTPRTLKWSLSLSISDETFFRISHCPRSCYMVCLSHPTLFNCPISFRWSVQVMIGCHVHDSPPLVPILSQINPAYILIRFPLNAILILSSHPRLSLPSSLSLSGFTTKIMYIFLVSPLRAACPMIHLPQFDHPSNMRRREPIM